MVTSSLPGLQALVAQIGLEPLQTFAKADTLNNPLDYHSYLAESLQALVECDPDVVYNSIQLSKTIEDGDLDIVLPKLKLDGIKPKELAFELVKKVSQFLYFCYRQPI
jgi:arginyl-tRNA synthetase